MTLAFLSKCTSRLPITLERMCILWRWFFFIQHCLGNKHPKYKPVHGWIQIHLFPNIFEPQLREFQHGEVTDVKGQHYVETSSPRHLFFHWLPTKERAFLTCPDPAISSCFIDLHPTQWTFIYLFACLWDGHMGRIKMKAPWSLSSRRSQSQREKGTNHQVDAWFQWGRYCAALMSSGKGGTVGVHM